MTFRFAFARRPVPSDRLHPAALGRITARAANDNGDAMQRDRVLREALRHFAAHGLRAAEDAGQRARSAHRAGDKAGYRHWIAICRALAPRRAARVTAGLRRGPRAR